MSDNEKILYTACPGLGDHENCTLKTIVRDGKIWRTEKLVYPPPEGDHAVICQKGLAFKRLVYSPLRLKYPLKRVGERGEGKFKRISWEQALDEICAKLIEQREKYGPESFALWNYLSSYPPNNSLHFLLASRFEALYGATDPMVGLGIDTAPFATNYFDFGHIMAYQFGDARKLKDSKYIIVWGTNPAELCHRSMRWIVEGRENGAKVVDIGIAYDATAAKSDWFIPVQAGSDTALALAMANVIVQENLIDEQFLLNKTVAPFLVRNDNGMFLREADIRAGGNPGFYLIWDLETNQPIPIPPHAEGFGATKPALRGTYTINGISCATAFQKMVERVQQYTPENQQAITGVPAEMARKLALEYATTKPAAIVYVLGLRYHNALNSYRAMDLLAALTGNLGVRGGGAFSPLGFGGSTPISYNDDVIMYPEGKEQSRTKFMRNVDFYDAVTTGKPYPIKSLFITSNPLHSWANRSRWVDEIFPNLELIIQYDIFVTETGVFCDYILPDCTSFEREEIIAPAFNWIVLQEPAVEPVGESRPPTYLWSELAKRLGYGQFFEKSTQEWLAIRLQSADPTIAGISPPLTYERLKQEKMVRANVPPEAPDLITLGIFLTDSGKMEFYSDHLAQTGEALPLHREQLESPRGPKAKQYPFQFFNGRKRFFMQSILGNDPLMIQLNGGEPRIRLNPVDAQKREVQDGDMIEVFNGRGKVRAKASISQAIPPGVVHVWFGWWKDQFPEGTYENLLLPMNSHEISDPSCEKMWTMTLEREGLGPMFTTQGYISDKPDILWDCLVDFKKVDEVAK